MAEAVTAEGQQALREMAVTMAKELGTTIVKLVPGIHGVCVIFASDMPMPGVIMCAENKATSDTLLELIGSTCRQMELLTHKMLGKDEDGRVDEHGKDSAALGSEGPQTPLPDGSDSPPDSEVHSKDPAAEGDQGKQD